MLMLAAAASSRGVAGGLAQRGAAALGSSPQLSQLAEQGRAAVVALLSDRIESLTDQIHTRTEALRTAAGPAGAAEAGETEEPDEAAAEGEELEEEPEAEAEEEEEAEETEEEEAEAEPEAEAPEEEEEEAEEPEEELEEEPEEAPRARRRPSPSRQRAATPRTTGREKRGSTSGRRTPARQARR
jgi:outer membrane biosynthesis protein TonB